MRRRDEVAHTGADEIATELAPRTWNEDRADARRCCISVDRRLRPAPAGVRRAATPVAARVRDSIALGLARASDSGLSWRAVPNAPGRCAGKEPARGPAQLHRPQYSLPLHRLEELAVRLRIFHLVEQEFDRGELVHRMQQLAQDPHLRELALVGDELFLTRA